MSDDTLMTATDTPDAVASESTTETTESAAETSTETTAETSADTSTEAKAEEVQPKAPAEYADFIMPEGVELNPELGGELKTLAKDLDLTQEQAQKLADLATAHATKGQQALSDQIEQAKTQWAADAKADKEFGGEQLQQNLGLAKKALDAFGTPELKTLLNESGLGNHPEVIRLMVRAGKAISEDSMVTSGQHTGGAKDPAKVLYPNQS